VRRICLLVAIVMTLGHSFRSAGLPALSAGGTAAIDRMFQAAVDKGEIPGASVAVTNRDHNTHFWVDPENGIGVVMMTQVLPFYNPVSMDVMKRFEHLIYENLSKE
jgi:CubicO group peptidase (beta-lactamase class C family)